ncbi:hypothetical protein DFA_05120 [Cavenderia fasciculata]|uniref:Integrase catalytic domain-containing protein n=1 Tax=Cavenderia fasciculata TaxID=261658 RepID=F4PND7_CACFS|nr:uncharacterized protein DFA_05120 [Cavenderia fasciculata]EGG22990.1 hypothetical protein DFA_05120 [Cavenderia fasciculata]|eukprot:XP_004360841.1 hypothetical protein DFA_05120 [Cavenderia fasciculata]
MNDQAILSTTSSDSVSNPTYINCKGSMGWKSPKVSNVVKDYLNSTMTFNRLSTNLGTELKEMAKDQRISVIDLIVSFAQDLKRKQKIGSGRSNKVLYDSEIERIMKPYHRKGFERVIASDQLNFIGTKRQDVIYNEFGSTQQTRKSLGCNLIDEITRLLFKIQDTMVYHLKNQVVGVIYQKRKSLRHNLFVVFILAFQIFGIDIAIVKELRYYKTFELEKADKEYLSKQEFRFVILPNDNGFKYALVVVDLASRLTDAEPLQNKTAKEVRDAFIKIYKRGILKPNIIQMDPGTEFKGNLCQGDSCELLDLGTKIRKEYNVEDQENEGKGFVDLHMGPHALMHKPQCLNYFQEYNFNTTSFAYYFNPCQASQKCAQINARLTNTLACQYSISSKESFPLAMTNMTYSNFIVENEKTRVYRDFTTSSGCLTIKRAASVHFVFDGASSIVKVEEPSSCIYTITINMGPEPWGKTTGVTTGNCGYNNSLLPLSKCRFWDSGMLKTVYTIYISSVTYFGVCSSPQICQRPEFGNKLPQSCTFSNDGSGWVSGGLITSDPNSWVPVGDNIMQTTYSVNKCSYPSMYNTILKAHCYRQQPIPIAMIEKGNPSKGTSQCSKTINFYTPLICKSDPSCIVTSPYQNSQKVDLSGFSQKYTYFLHPCPVPFSRYIGGTDNTLCFAVRVRALTAPVYECFDGWSSFGVDPFVGFKNKTSSLVIYSGAIVSRVKPQTLPVSDPNMAFDLYTTSGDFYLVSQ